VALRLVRSARTGSGRVVSSWCSSLATSSSCSVNSRAARQFPWSRRRGSSVELLFVRYPVRFALAPGRCGNLRPRVVAVAASRATTMGTCPVGASVQCGNKVAGSILGASETTSAAFSAPVIVTRESVVLTTGNSPWLVQSEDSLRLQEVLLLVSEQRVNLRHFVLGHLVQDFSRYSMSSLERFLSFSRFSSSWPRGVAPREARPCRLRLGPDELDERLTTLLGEGGKAEADDVTVVRGVRPRSRW